MPWYRLITVVTGLAARARHPRLLLYRTRLGVAMRAVVDNRELAALNGARPGLTSQFSWALGTSMAALAGIFLAEELIDARVETLTLLIVDAFAAAIIGRLKSLPMTYVGGMIIGLSLSFQANFLTWSGRWSSASFAIPTIILFLALLFLPQARIEGRRIRARITPRLPTINARLVGMRGARSASCSSGSSGHASGSAPSRSSLLVRVHHALARAAHGWSGQISLAQITFVGVGAWAVGRVRQRWRAGVRPRAVLGREPVGSAGRPRSSRCRSGC